MISPRVVCRLADDARRAGRPSAVRGRPELPIGPRTSPPLTPPSPLPSTPHDRRAYNIAAVVFVISSAAFLTVACPYVVHEYAYACTRGYGRNSNEKRFRADPAAVDNVVRLVARATDAPKNGRFFRLLASKPVERHARPLRTNPDHRTPVSTTAGYECRSFSADFKRSQTSFFARSVFDTAGTQKTTISKCPIVRGTRRNVYTFMEIRTNGSDFS